MSGALTALRDSACRGGARDCRPLPRTPILACGRPPPLCSGRVCLDELEHFVENQKASVASLRWCSPSARNGVRLPSGMLFSLVGIPSHYRDGCRKDERVELPLSGIRGISIPHAQPREIWELPMIILALKSARPSAAASRSG